MSSNDQTNQPSLIGGHAEYVKGVAQAAVGSVTGSQAWTASGEQAKAHAVSDMKAAGEARDSAGKGLGKAEELAGKAVGCEGMVREGGESKRE
ncbi:hypothetical protein M406DRAFT_355408 [Cryphonectria parasitica EP155]|uniref:CsbD-like domain-containing protein n=1 Tax=Cryphonectria parasitica (strain ATCC 38755 / EP155) TaxID=660469 RepID=A0A9P4Y581_CRYP1|nr:uncharacterized protein M406DRAFT_355408 [Cryphonectria parasitica EP155]KAF3766933.1 hypothetical protein M406DRAFT_355408 [Cryphonectria parasitica EP155]